MAKPSFTGSQIPGHSQSLITADLDGDGLTDLVLQDETNLFIYYQQKDGRFPRDPQQIQRLEHRPTVIWAAKLGRASASLLLMTSDGVKELAFTNRAGAADERMLIAHPTVVPSNAEGTNVMHLTLSLTTRQGWPLLLVPTAEGLEVWEHSKEWRRAEVLAGAMDSDLWPPGQDVGYNSMVELNLVLKDLNGDGLEDLLVRHRQVGGTNIYNLYLQDTNGMLSQKPSFSYSDRAEPHSWCCWADINHDGNLDLIKARWLNEPSFIPSIPSGKVLVSILLADAHGGIPSRPQYVLRKNDWIPAFPVADFDGDGFLDLALGYYHMDSREGVRKEITAKQVDYSLRFFFNRPGAGFQQEADFQRDVVIHLDHSETPLSWVLPQNFGRYVKVGGDFNGDGKMDLLVRDQSEGISVYFFISRQKGFTTEPALNFNCPEPLDEWEPMDLNQDGVSDLVVRLSNGKGSRIFVSHR